MKIESLNVGRELNRIESNWIELDQLIRLFVYLTPISLADEAIEVRGPFQVPNVFAQRRVVVDCSPFHALFSVRTSGRRWIIAAGKKQ